MPTLTDTDATILEIERQWWRYPGRKEAAVRECLGMSLTTYTQRLNALIDTEAALAADPITVKRLRRVRDARRRARGLA